MLITNREHPEIPKNNNNAMTYAAMYRHFGESNIVKDFNANKGWTTVTSPISIEQRRIMAKEDSLK